MAQLDRQDSRVWIGGVPVHRLTSAQWCRQMLADWKQKRRKDVAPKVATTANGQVIAMFAENAEFRRAILETDYIAADGMSVVFASQLATEAPLPERVATTDWFHAAAKAASRQGMRFYILGATPEMNALAVERVRVLYPWLELAGARDTADIPTGLVGMALLTGALDDLSRAQFAGAEITGQVMGSDKFEKRCPEMQGDFGGAAVFRFIAPPVLANRNLEAGFSLLRQLALRLDISGKSAVPGGQVQCLVMRQAALSLDLSGERFQSGKCLVCK